MEILKKKPEEMSFQEYWEEERRKGTKSEIIEISKHKTLGILRKKGFSDQQIDEMKMKKVWKFCAPALFEEIEKQTKLIESSAPRLLERAQRAFSALAKLTPQDLMDPEAKNLRKDLFELADTWDDAERALYELEETARRVVEELERQRQETKAKQKKE